MLSFDHMKPAFVVLLTVALSAFGLQANTDQRVEKAQAAADQWLKLVDSGDYGQSWDSASNLFKAHVSKSQWEKAIQATRSPFGQVVSRKVLKASYSDHLPGAPDGEYVVIQFETTFEHKKAAIETITPMVDGGEWKVSGYFIR